MGSPSPLFSFGGWYGSPFGRRRNHCSSRPREGGDHTSSDQLPGAIFQFTPPRRGRLLSFDGIYTGYVFQFTPPRRGRQAGKSEKESAQGHFNSRPREGGDFTPAAVEEFGNVFQFTPPRRGRPSTSTAANAAISAFQFTPPRRGRLTPVVVVAVPSAFQFTPPRRGRRRTQRRTGQF